MKRISSAVSKHIRGSLFARKFVARAHIFFLGGGASAELSLERLAQFLMKPNWKVCTMNICGRRWSFSLPSLSFHKAKGTVSLFSPECPPSCCFVEMVH